ncbi:Transmembrane protein 87B [Linum grandiflorum]
MVKFRDVIRHGFPPNPIGHYSIALTLTCLMFSCLSLTKVSASIHEYEDGTFIRRSNSYFFHGGSEGLYASRNQDEIPGHLVSMEDKPVKGKSFIRFESVIFRRPKESAERKNEMQQKTGLVEALIVRVNDRDKIGGSYLNTTAICCTPELAGNGSCKVGEVIIWSGSSNSPEGPKRLQTFFEGKNEVAELVLQTVGITHDGMYYLYFMFCDPELIGTTVSGRTVWRNPDGYLPGKMAPLMPFAGFMSLAYLGLGLVWFLWFTRYWKDVIQLHFHITAVIGLGMCEMALWYFEYANFNSNGSRPLAVTFWAVTFSAVKKTVSRLLLLVVSMGYGVVKPTLGALTFKVLLLGAAYFVASEALGLFENLGNINDFYGKARLILVLPVAVLDACFIVRRSGAKFALYQKFTNFLAASVLLSIGWIGYEETMIPFSGIGGGVKLGGGDVATSTATLEIRKDRKMVSSAAPPAASEYYVFRLGEDLEENKRE